MESIVCDIAKSRMEKDFNDALKYLGLTVTSIRFGDSEGLLIIVEMSVCDDILFCA